ncbi:sigma 54-interacting transcriptional regulator [Mangrovimicrobium sediminis]|uniref:sigma 54-interacting transcriptional regulator n=1 Tax=Mangrovimicrobium sediminis TaxID=2562682 RepID=UPI00143692A3|nr:sigma 54-interacting transcriptional regulator [Haliea sp. SAOS-164]
MKALDKHYLALDTCLVVVDRDSGIVLDYFGRLPFPTADGVCGRDWRDALGVAPDSSAVIGQAISAGVATALPPTIVGSNAERDYVMGGMLVPQPWGDAAAAVLFLRQLALPAGAEAEADIQPQDIVAVLGVDRLEFSPTWGAAETDRLMIDLRGGLQQILREQDWLGLPEGTTISVILRAIEPEAALDISRALLSHLHQRLRGRGGGAQYARACIGLAQRLEGQTALSALVAANNALLQAQAGGDERIRFASPWDPQGQAARLLNAGGAFRDCVYDPAARAFLRELLDLDARRSPDFLEQALHLLLQRDGLRAAAILQRDEARGLDVVYCAERVDDAIRAVTGRPPRWLQQALRRIPAEAPETLAEPGLGLLALPATEGNWGYLLLFDSAADQAGFRPGPAALQFLAARCAELAGRQAGNGAATAAQLPALEMEKGIEGYVLDNMEGAIDQAVFLTQVEIPVAIIGEQGTGKMYVAQIVHQESGGAPDGLVKLDCRSFRNRSEAWTRINRELQQGEGRTLVFKSPQLLHAEVQGRLARQLATRTASDERGGTRYLPRNRFIALFPVDPARLVSRGELDPRLASVFAGYPIQVPPLRERRRAVLRWAHKILEQESARDDRRMLGFTPDAEQALREHNWPGNISEMRDIIRNALTRTDKDWLTPVDLGLYIGISEDGSSGRAVERPFLELMQEKPEAAAEYAPSVEEELRLALGQALAASLETGLLRPLGAWLDDEIIEAACERFGEDARGAAEFLHTRTRNIGRWLPKTRERQAEREASLLWQDSARLARRWIMDSGPLPQSPQQVAEEMLMTLVQQSCAGVSVNDRARIMGVSTPTYQKRLKQLQIDA